MKRRSSAAARPKITHVIYWDNNMHIILCFSKSATLSCLCLTHAHTDGWIRIKEQYKVDTRYFSKRERQIKIVQKRRRSQRIVTDRQSF